MRRLTFILALLALLIAGTVGAYRVIEVPVVDARTTVVVVGGGVAATASCETQADTCDEAAGTTRALGRYDGQQYWAGAITADAGATVCKVCIKLWKTGTPSADHTLELWTDDGGGSGENLPSEMVDGTQQTFTPSTKVSATDQSTAESAPTCFDINWTFSNPGAKYFLVIGRTTSGDSANDYLNFARRNNCTPDNPYATSDETQATWVVYDAYYNMPYIFYKK